MPKPGAAQQSTQPALLETRTEVQSLQSRNQQDVWIIWKFVNAITVIIHWMSLVGSVFEALKLQIFCRYNQEEEIQNTKLKKIETSPQSKCAVTLYYVLWTSEKLILGKAIANQHPWEFEGRMLKGAKPKSKSHGGTEDPDLQAVGL